MGNVTADVSNHISGMAYDVSGHTLTDGNYTYTWDGEGQLKTAAGVTYTYDGDGRRAAKSGSKLYWYGSGGEILAETDAAGNKLNEYVFFGGRRVALVPATGTPFYYAEDLLGSSRVMVQSNGTLCYDADFTPFGGEKAVTSTCAQNYKFEGKERDAETQNDDFGAREYSWRYGRWLSSDWSAVPVAVPYANLTNPQTLNLYSMVADDPESFADLDGHQEPGANGGLVPPGVPASCASGVQTQCEAQQKPPQNQATTLPFPLIPELPDLGKFVTTAAGAVADVVTSAAVTVAVTIGYIVSPGTGGMTDQKDTIKGHMQSASVVVTPSGTAVPTDRGTIRGGFDAAGFPSRPATQTGESGTIHTVPTPNGPVDVRVMDGSAHHPPRIVITHPGTNSPKTPDGRATNNEGLRIIKMTITFQRSENGLNWRADTTGETALALRLLLVDATVASFEYWSEFVLRIQRDELHRSNAVKQFWGDIQIPSMLCLRLRNTWWLGDLMHWTELANRFAGPSNQTCIPKEAPLQASSLVRLLGLKVVDLRISEAGDLEISLSDSQKMTISSVGCKWDECWILETPADDPERENWSVVCDTDGTVYAKWPRYDQRSTLGSAE